MTIYMTGLREILEHSLSESFLGYQNFWLVFISENRFYKTNLYFYLLEISHVVATILTETAIRGVL